MKKTGKTLIACAVALSCALGTAAVAQANGTLDNAFLSKPLVYDEAYGVVNGNALMQSETERDGERIHEYALVNSEGTELYKGAYKHDRDGLLQPMTNGTLMPSSRFTDENGGIGLRNWETGEETYIAANGKVAVDNVSTYALNAKGTKVLGVTNQRDRIALTLADASTGKRIAAKTINISHRASSVYVSRVEGDTIHVIYGTNEETGNWKPYDIKVNVGEGLAIDEPVAKDDSESMLPGIFYSDGTLTMTLNEDRSVTIKEGERNLTIPGPFSFARYSKDGDVLKCAPQNGESGSEEMRFYRKDGSELFAGRGYTDATHIEGTEKYLCRRGGGSSKIWEIYNTESSIFVDVSSKIGDRNFPWPRVVGPYIVGDFEDSDLHILDADANPYKTVKRPNQDTTVEFSKTTLRSHPYQISYIDHSENDSIHSDLVDSSLNNPTEIDGQLDTVVSFGNKSYHLLKKAGLDYSNEDPQRLIGEDLQPLKVNGYYVVDVSYSLGKRDGLYVQGSDGKLGMVNDKGEMLLPAIFDDIADTGVDERTDKPYDEKRILVKKDGAWRFLDVSKLVPGQAPDPQPAPHFPDVDGSVAHSDDIAWLAAAGISKGFPDGGFHPYEAVKRCDMAAFLYRLAGKPDFEPTTEQTRAFRDVDASTPHAKEVWWLASEGISKGWDEPDGTRTFRPYDTVKRQDMAAFLHRLAGDRGVGGEGTSFLDVNAGTAHREDILWLAANGVSEGWRVQGGREFRGMKDVVRSDMAAFLHRMDQKGLVPEK